MNYLIIYHANCSDGVWAAWAALQAIKVDEGDSIECVGAYYNKPLPEQAWKVASAGGCILIVDFSYPKADLLALQDAGASLVQVIDHHETAMDQLSGFSDAVFDMGRSGAVLVWEAFSTDRRISLISDIFSQPSQISGQPVPELLKYVQDRDLWRHELPQTREVYTAMSHLRWMVMPPELLTERVQLDTGLAPTDPKIIDRLAEIGRPHFRARMNAVRQMADAHQFFVDLGDGLVPICQAQVYWSDVGNMLCHRFLDYLYVVLWRCDRNQDCVLDFRSLGYPVNDVAKRFGGGGHRKAAGCPVPADALVLRDAEGNAKTWLTSTGCLVPVESEAI